MPHIIVMPLVSQSLGAMLPRKALLAVLNRMYSQLSNHHHLYRGRRDPEDPDYLFDYVLYLADDEDTWHTFRFSVNDKIADGYFIVMGVSHRAGKFFRP